MYAQFQYLSSRDSGEVVLWSLPRLISPRGAGLGNEIFPWAKAYLGARALSLRLVQPPWRVNPRRYDREFRSSTAGVLQYFALRALPVADVTTEMVVSTGESDYYDAVVSLAPGLAARTALSLLHSSGMHGGYLGIRRARPYLRREILGTDGALAALERMDVFEDPCVRIGVHIRGGDFADTTRVRSVGFNEQLPLSWYVEVAQSLAAQLDVKAQVFLATDTPATGLNDALTLDGQTPKSFATNSVGDLAILSNCDIIISSVSSFSMLAIFLSDAPYVWQKDQLGESDGWLSIWGHEPEAAGGGPTLRAARSQSTPGIKVRRGVAQGSKPVWAGELLRQLEYRARSRRWSDDLIYHGVTESKGRL